MLTSSASVLPSAGSRTVHLFAVSQGTKAFENTETLLIGRLILAILVVLFALLCGSCRKPDAQELRLWVTDYDRGIAAAASEWEHLNPGWTVRVSIYAEGKDYQKLMTSVAGGDPPQLVMQDRFSVGEWASRGAFLPLDDYLGRYNVRKTDFYDFAWQEATYQGKAYGLPYNTDSRALLYNKRLLREGGFVDANGDVVPPKTWDDLRLYTQKLTKRNASGRITQLGFAPNFGDSWLYLYAFLKGGSFLSADGKTVTLDSQPVVDALTFIVSLYNDIGGLDQVERFTGQASNNAQHPFMREQVAMLINVDSFLDSISLYSPDLDFAVAPPPVPDGHALATWSGGFSFCIPATAKHPDKAFDLANYLTSAQGHVVRNGLNSQYSAARGAPFTPRMTARPAVNDQLYELYVLNNPNLKPNMKAAVKQYIDLLPYSHFRPVTPVGGILWEEQNRAVDRAARLGIPPRQALAESGANVQRVLDQILREQSGLSGQPRLPMPAVVAITVTVMAICAAAFWLFARRRRTDRDEAPAAMVFLSPWLIGLVVLTAGPVIASLLFSFCRYDVLHDAHFAGFDNYKRLFADELFWKSLLNTLYMLVAVPLGIVIGLAIALLLNLNVRGLKLYRTLYYLPAVFPGVATAVLWLWVLHPGNGLINSALRAVGVDNPPGWMMSPDWFFGSKASIVLMSLWGAGSGMVIWLAGLKTIPTYLYEAARLDGAGTVRQFFSVTLPMLSPYIFFNTVMGVIAVLQIFLPALLMTTNNGNGPADSTLFVAVYIFNSAFRNFDMGYASALAWVLLLIVLAFTALQLWVSKRWVNYDVV